MSQKKLTPEERKKKIEDWCQAMLFASGRDPRDVLEISCNENGTFTMKGKPFRFPIFYGPKESPQ